MERALTNLELKVMSNKKIGREEKEVLICAICPSGKPGIEYFNIDRIISCIWKNQRKSKEQVKRFKREIKKEFPGDKIRVLMRKIKRVDW